MHDIGSGPGGPSSAGDHIARYKAGEYIFQEGDPADVMFIIKRGEVAILRGDAGNLVSNLEEGDFFGETAILEDLPRVTTAKATSNCELLRIDRVTFIQLARYNPEVPIRMLRKLLRRLREVAGTGIRPTDASGEFPPAEIAVAPANSRPSDDDSVETALFVHEETQITFPLSRTKQTLVGRFDPVTGVRPEIELKTVDPERSISRRHARVARRGDSYFLQEEVGVANGTFVNGKRLQTGIEMELQEGDQVRFGLAEVVFHKG